MSHDTNDEDNNKNNNNNVTVRRFRETIVAVEKQRVLYISVCVYARGCPGTRAYACECARVALLIQHAKRMRHIVFSLVASVSTIFFPYYRINGTIFRKKKY
jgi:hypothetical protein